MGKSSRNSGLSIDTFDYRRVEDNIRVSWVGVGCTTGQSISYLEVFQNGGIHETSCFHDMMGFCCALFSAKPIALLMRLPWYIFAFVGFHPEVGKVLPHVEATKRDMEQ
jgi:hypothetical protein